MNEWIFIAATYDGTGYNGGSYGMDVYCNGVSYNSGGTNYESTPENYVAMEPSANDVYVGHYGGL